MNSYSSKKLGVNSNSSAFCRNVCNLFRSGRASCRRDCAACCKGKRRMSANVKSKNKHCGCGH
ncbi:MAG: hypothetical protein K0Q81_897 [Paenibacillus sp.]|nr:hypothetical protein [Paenibacillus sp.]